MRPGRIAIALAACAVQLFAADSRQCANCHADIYRRYMLTPMARTSGVAGAALPRESLQHAAFRSQRGGAIYSVSADSGAFSFDFSSGAIRGRRKLDYFIGSGVVGRSYLTDIDGFLFQAPVSYYSGPASWEQSPGYERDEEINLMREVEPGCLNCHATGLQTRAGSSNGYSKPPFRKAGVGCERCHGSGDAHVQSAGSMGIVNPAKLDPQRRESVCAQCHLPGAVEIARSGARRSFRPGLPLSDSVTVFVWAGSTRETTVNGHFEQLARSACKQASGAKLWCGTCHDAHASTSDYRGKCLGCHSTASCKAPASVRAKDADNCVSCHMPRTTAVTVQHAAYTDHSIPRIPRPESSLKTAPDAQLVPFAGFAPDDRDLGLAYATVAIRDANPIWGKRAFELLRNANERDPSDSKVASNLAALYDRMGDEKEACKLYARVAKSGDTAPAPAVNYGTCLAQEGNLDEAMRLWSGVSRRNPGNEAARLNLAVAQFRSGQVGEARANLNEALRFNPVSKRARELLHDMNANSPAR